MEIGQIKNCYEALGMAIVEQAAIDYYKARFFLDTIEKRSFCKEAVKRNRINTANRTIVEVENFFKSDWFKTVCPTLDGPRALEAMKETYIRERYDEMMEKFLLQKGIEE